MATLLEHVQLPLDILQRSLSVMELTCVRQCHPTSARTAR